MIRDELVRLLKSFAVSKVVGPWSGIFKDMVRGPVRVLEMPGNNQKGVFQRLYIAMSSERQY